MKSIIQTLSKIIFFTSILLSTLNQGYSNSSEKPLVNDNCQALINNFAIAMDVPEELLPGETYIIPVLAQGFSNVITFQYTLSFNPNVIKVVDLIDSGILNGQISSNLNISETGNILLLWTNVNAESQSVPDNTQLFFLEVEVTGNFCEESSFSITEGINDTEIFFKTSEKECLLLEPFPIILINPIVISSDGLNVEFNICSSESSNQAEIKVICGEYPIDWIFKSGSDFSIEGVLTEDNNTTTISDIPDGLIIFEATDAAGNSFSNFDDFGNNINLEENTPLLASINVVQDFRCDLSSGQLGVEIQGGLAPYSVKWSNGFYNTDQIDINSPGGVYIVTVTDNWGCTTMDLIQINSPEPIMLEITETEYCEENSPWSTYQISGGTPFENNEYLINGILSPPTDTIFFGVNPTIDLLIEDMNGCSKSETIQAEDLIVGANTIFIDEKSQDWEEVPDLLVDEVGDSNFGVDYTFCKIFNDNDYIYFQLGLAEEINFQEDNEMFIKINYVSEFGGSELNYKFGDRSGLLLIDNRGIDLFHNDIGLVSSPTVSSDTFEFVIRRDISTANEDFGKIGGLIRISFDTGVGDRMPNIGDVTHVLEDCNDFIQSEVQFDISANADFRFLSYNVLRDNLFEPAVQAAYTNIFKTIKPDIIAFQEIYDHTAFETQALYTELTGETDWFSSKKGTDIILLSRYPILDSRTIGGNGVFMVDVEGTTTVIFNVHFRCCQNNVERQAEIDEILSTIRHMKEGTYPEWQIPANTPIIVAGDMNLVGPQSQQHSIINGDIQDEQTYGEDVSPDWNGHPFRDSQPKTTGHPSTFTWFSVGESFSPGRLDYVLYTGSVLSLENSYNLFTPTLNGLQLQDLNISPRDVTDASDHLPVVTDFAFGEIVSTSTITAESLSLIIFPNPTNGEFFLDFEDDTSRNLSIMIYTIDGQVTMKDINFVSRKGNNVIPIDIDLDYGVYFIKLSDGTEVYTARVVVID